MSDKPWTDWKRGPAPFGDVMDRIVAVLGSVPPAAREKISAAMREARFDVTLTVGDRTPAGATVAMTIPTKDEIPLGLQPVLLLLGWPDVMPSSITPLAWDRMRAFWEFGNAPVRGELAFKSRELAAAAALEATP